MAKIRTSDNLFGDGKTIYDEYGNVIGTQQKDLFGDGVSTYDKYGNKVATSYKDTFGDGVSTYDKYGNKVSTTYQNTFGEGTSTYDKYGNKIAETYRDTWDPSSSTTYTAGTGNGYGTGISYEDLYGTTSADTYSGGGYSGPYYGYHDNRSPREKKKDRVCSVFATIAIVILVLDAVWCLAGLFVADKVRLDLDIYLLAYAAGVLILSFFSGFEFGELDGANIAWTIFASLGFLFLYGQATYNSHGYNAASASITYRAIGNMAVTGLICIAAGWAGGLFAEKVFMGNGKDGRLGTVLTALVALTALYGGVTVLMPKYMMIPLAVYRTVCYVLCFLYLFNVIRKKGGKGVFRALLTACIFTGGFTALFHNQVQRLPLRVLFDYMTSMDSLRYYIIFGVLSVLSMILGAVVKKKKG